jgi:ribonuclease HI
VSQPLKQVTIYADGACLGNPGPGGYGTLLFYGSHRREISGGCRLTTNNRMELRAAIAGLAALKERCAVTLYTDSQYVADGISKGWAQKWQQNGWQRNRQEKAKNIDLWEDLLALCRQQEVKFCWIRGHAGHPENEYCDKLAVAAAKQPELPPDLGYEDREIKN